MAAAAVAMSSMKLPSKVCKFVTNSHFSRAPPGIDFQKSSYVRLRDICTFVTSFTAVSGSLDAARPAARPIPDWDPSPNGMMEVSSDNTTHRFVPRRSPWRGLRPDACGMGRRRAEGSLTVGVYRMIMIGQTERQESLCRKYI